MTVKKNKFKEGPFVVTEVDIDINNNLSKTGMDFIKRGLDALTPEGRINGWKSLAEELKVQPALVILAEAEKLIPTLNRNVFVKFDSLLRDAQLLIERQGYDNREEKLVPMAERGKKNLKTTSEGGLNSHGSLVEREERDNKILKNYDEKKLNSNLSEGAIFRRLAREYSLNKDHIRQEIVRPQRPLK